MGSCIGTNAQVQPRRVFADIQHGSSSRVHGNKIETKDKV